MWEFKIENKVTLTLAESTSGLLDITFGEEGTECWDLT